ncbi:hypothetical protein [Streptomyces sp. CA-111067]|uniref:hypothetical protein n=1 Tax=Streptomyces sp. CA-111067 TaxID=3240046 RepID=UPI003D98F307
MPASRRAVLAALAAGALLPGLGKLSARADSASRDAMGPLDLHFRITQRYRPLQPLSAFVTLDDGFDADSTARYEALHPTGEAAGTLTAGGGALAVSGDAPYFALLRSGAAQQAPYSTVLVDVRSMVNTCQAEDSVFAGLARDERNYVTAWYNNVSKTVGVDVVTDGGLHPVALASASLAAPFSFGLILAGDTAGVLAREADGDWRVLSVQRTADLLDLRAQDLPAAYRNTFGARADHGTIVLDRVRGGYSGYFGLRDTCIVTAPDGTPHIEDDRLFFTATAAFADPASSHQCVFSLNLADTTDVVEVGKTFVRRDGRIVGDHAGKVVVDPDLPGLRVFASTWGTSDLETTAVGTEVADLPGAALAGIHLCDVPGRLIQTGYDPCPTLVDGAWQVPVAGTSLYRFDAALESGGQVAAADDGFYEGPRTLQLGGTWYVMAGGIKDFRVYRLADLSFVGFLDAEHPQAPAYPFGNPPHPSIAAVPQPDGSTRYVMVTFDIQTLPGAVGLGNLVIEEAVA